MNFKLQKVQTALFIKDFSITGYDKYSLIGELKDSVGDIFDAEPVAFPLPPDAPLDIPRIILNNKKGVYSCNIALNRIDIFRNKPQDEEEKLEDILGNQKEQVKKVYDFFNGRSVIINRVGFVVTFLSEIKDKSGAEYLKETFLVADKLENPRELRLIYNKRASDNSVEFNHLVTLIGRQDNKLVLQIDINTIPEIMKETNFAKEKLIDILNYSVKKTKQIKDNFPNFKV